MNRLTQVVKNLLILNVAVFLISSVMGIGGINDILGLYYYGSPSFQPFQIFTYMFSHGGFMHLLFNMLGLFFLGPLLEQFWGSQKFLIFYVVCGIGAGLIYNGINFTQLEPMRNKVESYELTPSPESFYTYIADYRIPSRSYNRQVLETYEAYSDNPQSQNLQNRTKRVVREIYEFKRDIPMVGASGAIYGLLMAIGMLFPNTQFMLLFPPIPIKAKYLVLIFGGIALYSGFQSNPGDNTAHFAHLGGMIFAFIMIRAWRKNRNEFY